MSIKVLSINSNQRSESLIPQAIAIFSSLLKNKGQMGPSTGIGI